MKSKVTELDSNITRLTGLLIQTTEPQALLRSIETLEKDRRSAVIQLEAALDAEQSSKTMKALSTKDVKAMLNGIIDNLQNEKNQNIIKDMLATFIESIVLNAADFTITLTYRISNNRGVKLASPRGFEPRSPP